VVGLLIGPSIAHLRIRPAMTVPRFAPFTCSRLYSSVALYVLSQHGGGPILFPILEVAGLLLGL